MEIHIKQEFIIQKFIALFQFIPQKCRVHEKCSVFYGESEDVFRFCLSSAVLALFKKNARNSNLTRIPTGVALPDGPETGSKTILKNPAHQALHQTPIAGSQIACKQHAKNQKPRFCIIFQAMLRRYPASAIYDYHTCEFFLVYFVEREKSFRMSRSASEFNFSFRNYGRGKKHGQNRHFPRKL